MAEANAAKESNRIERENLAEKAYTLLTLQTESSERLKQVEGSQSQVKEKEIASEEREKAFEKSSKEWEKWLAREQATTKTGCEALEKEKEEFEKEKAAYEEDRTQAMVGAEKARATADSEAETHRLGALSASEAKGRAEELKEDYLVQMAELNNERKVEKERLERAENGAFLRLEGEWAKEERKTAWESIERERKALEEERKGLLEPVKEAAEVLQRRTAEFGKTDPKQAFEKLVTEFKTEVQRVTGELKSAAEGTEDASRTMQSLEESCKKILRLFDVAQGKTIVSMAEFQATRREFRTSLVQINGAMTGVRKHLQTAGEAARSEAEALVDRSGNLSEGMSGLELQLQQVGTNIGTLNEELGKMRQAITPPPSAASKVAGSVESEQDASAAWKARLDDLTACVEDLPPRSD